MSALMVDVVLGVGVAAFTVATLGLIGGFAGVLRKRRLPATS